MPRCNDPITVRSLASAALLALVVACSSGNGGNSAQAPIQGEAHDPSEPAPPTAADARSLLDRRFAAQPACGAFFAMPWDVSTDSARDRRRATALVQAGLLRPAGESRLPGAGGGQAALRFVPTAAGAATFRAPAADEGGLTGASRTSTTSLPAGRAHPLSAAISACISDRWNGVLLDDARSTMSSASSTAP